MTVVRNGEILADDLKEVRFIFHGTLVGHFEDIKQQGLPGEVTTTRAAGPRGTGTVRFRISTSP